MKFRKTLIINIDKSALDSAYWSQIDQLTSKIVHLPKDSPQIKKELHDSDCLLVNFGISVTKEMLDIAKNLRYVGVLATAFGKIDIDHAKKKSIIVCNLAGYSTESVAEFIIAATLESLRCLEQGKQRGRNKNYSEDGLKAREIKGKIFGIVGLGNIGKRVGQLAEGFGAEVRYWSRHKKIISFKYENADSLFKVSDFISINLAQTRDTEKFLNEKRLQSIKAGAIIINTAPMELVDIDALSNRLRKADITFILDHSDEMSEEALAKLSKYDNCIIYPPIAYITDEARMNKQNLFLSNMKNFLKGSPTNVVNK